MEAYALFMPNITNIEDVEAKIDIGLQKLLTNGELYVEGYEFTLEKSEEGILNRYLDEITGCVVLASKVTDTDESKYLNDNYCFMDKGEFRFWILDIVPSYFPRRDLGEQLRAIVGGITGGTPAFSMSVVSIDMVGYNFVWDAFYEARNSDSRFKYLKEMRLGYKLWFASGKFLRNQIELLDNFGLLK